MIEPMWTELASAVAASSRDPAHMTSDAVLHRPMIRPATAGAGVPADAAGPFRRVVCATDGSADPRTARCARSVTQNMGARCGGSPAVSSGQLPVALAPTPPASGMAHGAWRKRVERRFDRLADAVRSPAVEERPRGVLKE